MKNPHLIRFLAENQASQPSPPNLNGDVIIKHTDKEAQEGSQSKMSSYTDSWCCQIQESSRK